MLRKLVAGLFLLAAPAAAQVSSIPPQSSSAGVGTEAVHLTQAWTAPAYGSELVTNGTFTGSATGWTLGGGGGAPDWAYAANAVSHTSGGGTATLTPSTPIVPSVGTDTFYMITFTLSSVTSGTLTVSFAGGSATYRDSGTYDTFFGVASTANLAFTPTNDFAGTIDDISVKTATKASSAFSIPHNTGSDGIVELRSKGNDLYFGAWSAPWANANTYWNVTLGWGAGFNFGGGGPAVLNRDNVCIGTDSCNWSSRLNDSVFVGAFAGRLVSGNSANNTAVGSGALQLYPTGAIVNGDTMIGTSTGQNWNSDNSTCVGYNNCITGTALNNVTVLGYNITPVTANTAVVGNGSTTDVWIGDADGSGAAAAKLHTKGIEDTGTTFASLGTPANGTLIYCSDCTIANPCAGSGTGAFAKRLNGAWVCN